MTIKAYLLHFSCKLLYFAVVIHNICKKEQVNTCAPFIVSLGYLWYDTGPISFMQINMTTGQTCEKLDNISWTLKGLEGATGRASFKDADYSEAHARSTPAEPSTVSKFQIWHFLRQTKTDIFIWKSDTLSPLHEQIRFCIEKLSKINKSHSGFLLGQNMWCKLFILLQIKVDRKEMDYSSVFSHDFNNLSFQNMLLNWASFLTMLSKWLFVRWYKLCTRS